jgi:hypothetical protein
MDLLKEFIRSKIMDWVVLKFGPTGFWLVNNPFAFLTVAMLGFVGWCSWVVVKDWITRPKLSPILDHNENRIEVPVMKGKVVLFLFVTTFCVVAVAYGQYKYSIRSAALDNPYVNIFNWTPPRASGNYLLMDFTIVNPTFAPAKDSATAGYIFVEPDISESSEKQAMLKFQNVLDSLKGITPPSFTLGPRQRITYTFHSQVIVENPVGDIGDFLPTMEDVYSGKKSLYALAITRWTNHGVQQERHFCQAIKALVRGSPPARKGCTNYND